MVGKDIPTNPFVLTVRDHIAGVLDSGTLAFSCNHIASAASLIMQNEEHSQLPHNIVALVNHSS